MHIREVLLQKNIIFEEDENGHITVNRERLYLVNEGITILENITFNVSDAVDLQRNSFTEMKNVHFSGKWLDLMPSRELINLDGLTVDLSGRGGLLYNRGHHVLPSPKSTKYRKLFTNLPRYRGNYAH